MPTTTPEETATDNTTPEETTTPTSTTTVIEDVTATEVIEEYTLDDIAAAAKYGGKTYNITYNASIGEFIVYAEQEDGLKEDSFTYSVTQRPVAITVQYDWYKNSDVANITGAGFSPYNNATIIEPQIPSAWCNSSITVKVNLGAFTGSTAYLFVFDSDNNRNATGYPVAIGGGVVPALMGIAGEGGSFAKGIVILGVLILLSLLSLLFLKKDAYEPKE